MKKIILVVDDSQTIRKFISASLGLGGYQVVTASDGMEALEKLPQEMVDLIITDLNMPDMDGFEFIKALREASQYQSIPVIILSSMTDSHHKEIALQLGVHSYIEKPFSAEKLRDEVRRFLN